MRATAAARAYQQNNINAQMADRSPEELISLLFDRGCELILSMEQQLACEPFSVETYGETAQKAIKLVLSLRAVLDMENGGDVAASLYEAYSVIASCLFKQIRERDKLSLNKLHKALSEIREAWKQSIA